MYNHPVIRDLYTQLNTIIKPSESSINLDFINQIASLFSVGPFHYFIFDFDAFQFEYVHPNIKKVLGIKPDELTFNKYFEIMHPDDVKVWEKKERVIGEFLLQKINPKNIPDYKVVHLMRFKGKNDNYLSILHQTRALTISNDNKIQKVIAIQTDITHLRPVIDYNFSLVSDTLPSYYSVDTGISYDLIESNFKDLFSKREIEIIKKVSEGLTAFEIANELNIANETVQTHKKNILKKSGCKNTAHLISRAIREGII